MNYYIHWPEKDWYLSRPTILQYAWKKSMKKATSFDSVELAQKALLGFIDFTEWTESPTKLHATGSKIQTRFPICYSDQAHILIPPNLSDLVVVDQLGTKNLIRPTQSNKRASKVPAILESIIALAKRVDKSTTSL